MLFFLSIGITSIAYSIEKKFYLGLIAFLIGLISWISYGMKFYIAGVSVPETISSIAVVSLIVYSAFRIYLGKYSAIK